MTLLHQVYAEQMKNNPYGIALYHPESNIVIRPGMCGYLNNLGRWNPVVDLTDEEELRAGSYTLLSSDIQKAPRSFESWGPKCSMSVKYRTIDLSVGASAVPAGFPVGAKAFYEFSTSSTYGAILTTSSAITRESFYHEAPFRKWCKENSETLFRNRPELRDYHLWIVTSTYAAEACSLNASLSKTCTITLGFAIDAVQSGEIAPSGSVYHASADSGWIHFPGNGTAKDVQTQDQHIESDTGNTDNAGNAAKQKQHRDRRSQSSSERNQATTSKPPTERSRPQKGKQKAKTRNNVQAPKEPVRKDQVVVFMGGLRFSYISHPLSRAESFLEVRPRSWWGESWDICITGSGFALLFILSIITLGILPFLLLRKRRRGARGPPGQINNWQPQMDMMPIQAAASSPEWDEHQERISATSQLPAFPTEIVPITPPQGEEFSVKIESVSPSPVPATSSLD